MKTFGESCNGMKTLIEKGAIVTPLENIDEKGWSTNVYLVMPDGKQHMIRFCPYCGELVQNLLIDKSKCSQADIPREGYREIENCEPDCPEPPFEE